jgi:hypothetical protein
VAPKKEAADGDRIARLLDRHFPDSKERKEHIASAVARLGFVQFEWTKTRPNRGKPVSLRIHYIHEAVVNTDIHPYQELHGCQAIDFLHTGRHWFVASFGHYFTFLRDRLSQATIDASPIKAAKRAVVMFGMIGDLDSQKILLSLLHEYALQDPERNRDTIERIKQMVDALRREVELNMTMS